MILFPAIDLYDRKAVRLFRGDYREMTVYSHHPIELAEKFTQAGATHIHIVDLEGAKIGDVTDNFAIVREIAEKTPLYTEIGGGIRRIETVDAYFDAGVDRVILGTAAIADEAFLQDALKKYGDRIAVGADLKDGKIAVKGWLECTDVGADEFFGKMQAFGVKTVICTDISKDGAMQGTNLELYRDLSKKFQMNITASGGVSTLDDIRRLREMDLYGAIVGKAYYTGAIDLKEAVALATGEDGKEGQQ